MLAQNFEYELKAKNRIQISAEYGISPRVLALRIKKYELDIPQGDILPKHQKSFMRLWATQQTLEWDSYSENLGSERAYANF